MARVIAYVPDLLFGSNVVGALSAAGHEVTLVSGGADLAGPGVLDGVDVLVVDLTDDVGARIAAAAPALGAGSPVRTLAFFSHVEADVKTRAVDAGFDLVVPRSRMARAAGDLVSQLAAG